VRFGLGESEFADLEAAAAWSGLARGAYAAEAALAVARGGITATGNELLRDALAELVRSAGLVRRIGVNLNQAVAKLNATGAAIRRSSSLCGGKRPPRGPPG
jgi:transposase